jgi:YbbR domain-containing protein
MLAAALWFYTTKPEASKTFGTISHVLSKTPVLSKTWSDSDNAFITLEAVPIIVKGLKPNAKTVVVPQTASVVLKLDKETKISVNDLNSIRLEIDIKDQQQGTIKVDLKKVSIPEYLKIVKITPQKVEVRLEPR